MSETKDKEKTTEDKDQAKEKKTLSLGGKGTLSLNKEPRKVQSVSRGRGQSSVSVEVRRKRSAQKQEADQKSTTAGQKQSNLADSDLQDLTSKEREARIQALREAEKAAQEKKEEAARKKDEPEPEDTRQSEEDLKRQQELAELQRIEEEERRAKEEQARQKNADSAPGDGKSKDQEEEESYRDRMKRHARRRLDKGSAESRRRSGKLTVTQVLNEEYEREKKLSEAAQRRAREKARMAESNKQELPKKVTREVVIPEVITVQELSNRMAEASGEVVKALMKLGVMATINQPIDADTAELVVEEFGHKVKRVTEADVEEGLEGPEDAEGELADRPPVVTVMGHVDHGKTSLLDALRQTDVVAGEAGGITQHIGAYQVTMPGGDKITFLDTPGHAAFTEMRSRGANVTDIVVIVVAADDSIMPQTIEAINHAKAAGVPVIIAINKIDLPGADPQKVKNDLLSHEIVPEDMGGDVLCIEVSAVQKTNLDKLEESILLQAELLELKANPDRSAIGVVVEAKLEQGRGNVATVLVEKGTFKTSDVFVVGSEWGKVRALIDDHGQTVDQAIPGQPVEVLGLNGAPEAGDRLTVVESEQKAREVSEYRQRKKREAAVVKTAGKESFEQLMQAAKEADKETLSVVVKGDVHGSVEALVGSLQKLETDQDNEFNIQVLHSGVGAITESDITLAKASLGLIIGFNVRANAKAREMAEQQSVEIRYYNVIYDVIDDVKSILSGMLEPTEREQYLGQAEIRQVFKVSKVGNVAGCMVTKGVVKRGANVRLLRDDVVIHEGKLSTLKRHQDDAKEVKEGTECGMSFENYNDIKEGDVIECYEIVEEQRQLK